MANRKPRKRIKGLFLQTSIAVVEHPDLPGLNLYRLHTGTVDTRTPPEEARVEFSRLVSYLHAEQEKSDRYWLEGKVRLLCFPQDQERRLEMLARVNKSLKGFKKIQAPTKYDLAMRRISESAATHLPKLGARLSHTMIRNRLTAIYGPAFTSRFSVDQVRRAYTHARKALRKSTPHSAQL